MGGRKSAEAGRPGWLPFDLLGHPVPPNKGCRGKPQHVPTAENLEKAVLLYANKATDGEVAAALQISVPTLKLHYLSRSELRQIRRNAKAVVEAELLARLNEQSKAGNVGATEKLLKRMDKAQLGAVPATPAKPKAKPKGVKEQQVERAWAAGLEDQNWGSLLHPKHQA